MNTNYSAREIFTGLFFLGMALTFSGLLTVPALLMAIDCLIIFILIVLRK